MIKYLIHLLVITLMLYSCGDSKSKQTISVDENLTPSENLIDTTFIRIINEIRESITLKETNNILIDSLIIALKFDNNDNNKNFFGADTVCFISFFVDGINYSECEFKGILDMINYKITVFDKYDMGGCFYNNSELKQIDIKDLYKPHINLVAISVCKIKGNSLIQWIGR